jgi:hypothetical protein
MKTKIVTLVAASMLFTGSLNASEKFISAGFASANIDGTTSAAPVVDIGIKFGKTYKQKIGTRFIFVGENKDFSDGQGNLGDIYYSLGHDVYKNTTLSAKLGMEFQSLGTDSSGDTVYASGLSYGLVMSYEVSKSFDIGVSYTKSNLSYQSLSYDVDVIDASVSYSF